MFVINNLIANFSSGNRDVFPVIEFPPLFPVFQKWSFFLLVIRMILHRTNNEISYLYLTSLKLTER